MTSLTFCVKTQKGAPSFSPNLSCCLTPYSFLLPYRFYPSYSLTQLGHIYTVDEMNATVERLEQVRKEHKAISLGLNPREMEGSVVHRQVLMPHISPAYQWDRLFLLCPGKQRISFTPVDGHKKSEHGVKPPHRCLFPWKNWGFSHILASFRCETFSLFL